MSTTSSAMIAMLNTARVQNNRYFTIIVFIIGVIGNCLNVLVLSQPILSQVPTTRYFLAASGASLASLTSGLVARIMSGWAADPASYNTSLCKFQVFVNKVGQTSCSYFLLAATMDRWFLSNQNRKYRQLSSMKNSTRIIIFILLIVGSYHSLHSICYEAFQTAPPLKCYAGSIVCRYFENISYTFTTILIPQCLMLVFGWKTISNIRQSRRRIKDNNSTKNSIFNTTNANHLARVRSQPTTASTKAKCLTRMLIIQVFTYILLTLPAAGEALYMTITIDSKGSELTDLQLAIDRFMFAFTTVLSYMSISLPFYLYTLMGSVFRQTLWKLLTSQKLCSIQQ